MNDNHINYVEFAASNFKATQDFFAKAFGWTFQSWGEDYCSFSNAGLEGGFYRSEKLSKYEQGAPLIVLYSKQLEATQRMVEEAGGKIVAPIFSFPGGRRFHFCEPSGNELAVWSEK